MTKKHYITLSICALLIIIGVAIFCAYYRDYVKPKSYTVGVIKKLDYKELVINDYVSDENVLFSQNINNATFKRDGSSSIYEFNFDPTDFNGEEKNYLIYVNDYLINDISETAGTIGGVYTINYFDVNKQVICSSDININFSFYSLQSKLKVSLNTSEISYLMNYFKTDNFVITLIENQFEMNSTDITVEKPPVDELTDIVVEIYSDVDVEVLHNNDKKTFKTDGMFGVLSPSYVGEIDAKALDSVDLYFTNVDTKLEVITDGTYEISYNGSSNCHTISWSDASYLNIGISKGRSSGSDWL